MHLHVAVKVDATCINSIVDLELASDASRPRDDPAGHRDRHPRGGGIAQRQAFQAPRRQKAERLRLDGVRRPAQRIRGLGRSPAASRSRSIRSMVRLRAPPPATIQLFGSFGSSGTIRAIAAAVNAVSVAAPSAGGIIAELQARQNRCDRAISAAAAQRTAVPARARSRPHRPCPARRCGPRHRTRWFSQRNMWSSSSALPGPGVAGDQRVAVDIGDVGRRRRY